MELCVDYEIKAFETGQAVASSQNIYMPPEQFSFIVGLFSDF